jgi:hypothetical protein
MGFFGSDSSEATAYDQVNTSSFFPLRAQLFPVRHWQSPQIRHLPRASRGCRLLRGRQRVREALRGQRQTPVPRRGKGTPVSRHRPDRWTSQLIAHQRRLCWSFHRQGGREPRSRLRRQGEGQVRRYVTPPSHSLASHLATAHKKASEVVAVDYN